jgi:hypothetical protein
MATACVVAWAAAGWACVPQSALLVSPTSSGPPGSKVTVMGYRFGDNPVELRWDKLDGPLLATAKGPDFQADVTIPSDSTGLNTIVGFIRAPDGSVGTAIQVAQFNVTGAGAVGSTPRAAAASAVGDSSGAWSTGAVLAALGGVLLIGLGAGVLAGGRRRRSARPAAGPSVGGAEASGSRPLPAATPSRR